MDMPESFHFSLHLKNLLFWGWTTNSVAGMFCTCVVMTALAVLLEGTKMLSAYLHTLSKLDPLKCTVTEAEVSERSPLLHSLIIPPSINDIRRKKLQLHVMQTLAMLLHLLLGYLLMLAVMTYNAWIMVAALTGSGIGYFIFGVFRQRLSPITHSSVKDEPTALSTSHLGPSSNSANVG